MILREYIECDTCGKHYRMRIQVGLRDLQPHSFHCVTCKERIGLTLQTSVGIKTTENCHFIAEDPEALSYYLSPDFVASADQIHDPESFPALDFMRGLFHQLKSTDGIVSETLEEPKNHPTWRIDRIWTDVQKAWRLHDAGQYKLSNKILDKIQQENQLDDARLPHVQYFLIGSMFNPNTSLVDEVNIIKNLNSDEFSKFVHYYQINLKKPHIESVYSILVDYFSAFNDFTQVYLYVKNSSKFPKDAIATSVNFNSVKQFYAKCYEFYAGAICIFTCLNNIKNGRNFDQLEKIPLKTYLRTDKAERRKSIENNTIFYEACTEFDSSIRNAAYHDWFRLTENKQEIEYRSGGTGQLRTISYSLYLYKCSIILEQICRLFAVELVLDDYARRTALVTMTE